METVQRASTGPCRAAGLGMAAGGVVRLVATLVGAVLVIVGGTFVARPLYWGLTPELKQYAVRAGRLTRVQADPAQKAALPLSSHQQRANQIELNAREIAGLSRALDAIAEKDVVASAERRRRRVRRRLLVSPS